MSDGNKIKKELRKILIPCRTVLELEALTSLYLTESNFKKIKEIARYSPTSERLINLLDVEGTPLYENIVRFFIDHALPKIKAIRTETRDHSKTHRKGDFLTFKSNTCLYLALHRLKFKFLVIKSIIDQFKNHKFDLEKFNIEKQQKYTSFLTALADLYHQLNLSNIEIMFPQKKVSERLKKLMDNEDAVTAEKLLNLITSKKFSEKTNIIKFIMREIKASLFVCKIMLAQMDINDPFCITRKRIIDAEEIMVSNDFIPELIPALARGLRHSNEQVLNHCSDAFYFLLDEVLLGINNAIKTASRNKLELELYELIFDTQQILQN
ncbi:MAG: hypothetical protein BAJALOKI1v1_30014 [Promethearchaeota archaeon]|nr:MAG: hypothetical protein BAJALOKI1v1_30014 [Candidatus Lokiarchaeota archaeon]